MQVLGYLCCTRSKFVYALIHEICPTASVQANKTVSEYALLSDMCQKRIYGISIHPYRNIIAKSHDCIVRIEYESCTYVVHVVNVTPNGVQGNLK